MRNNIMQQLTQTQIPAAETGESKNASGPVWRTLPSDAIMYFCCLATLSAWLMLVRYKFRLLELPFDDAYMFYRYATNMRAGYGIAWNPGAAHVYGVTSPAWLLCIWLGTFVSHSMVRVVTGASIVAGVSAMAAMAWAVSWNATSRLFQRFSFVLFAVGAVSLTMFTFVNSAANGMETSLALGAFALLAGCVFRWLNAKMAFMWIPLAGMLAFLSRPESALTTCLLIAVAWMYLPGARRKEAWSAMILFAGLVGVQLLICRWYFGTALPLSFYVKSEHLYVGYIGRWHPVTLLFENLRSCRIPLLLTALFASRKDIRLLLLFLLPASATMLYLSTTLQIMGFWSRYYMPYSAFFVIAAFLVADRRYGEYESRKPGKPVAFWARVSALAIALCLIFGWIPHRLEAGLDNLSEGKIAKYNIPEVKTSADTSLPSIPGGNLFPVVTNALVKRLPAGAAVGASEVGYLAAAAPQIKVIDLVGLNDTYIARHGFDMQYLFSLAPDVIWFPHDDYTHQRGVMMSDPRFLANYDFYPGAANFGLAVRKSGRLHAEVEQGVLQFWRETYPTLKMDAFRASAVSWDGRSQMIDPRDASNR